MSETILQRQTLQAGNRVLKEGQEGHLSYIVQSGEVEIFKVIGRVDHHRRQPHHLRAKDKKGGSVHQGAFEHPCQSHPVENQIG